MEAVPLAQTVQSRRVQVSEMRSWRVFHRVLALPPDRYDNRKAVTLQKLSFLVEIKSGAESPRLDHFLAESAKFSRAQARKLIVAGAVYLNGKRVRIASKPVFPGARVEAFVDPARMNTDHRSPSKAPVPAIQVLFEDEALLVIFKPAGFPTQPTLDEARDNAFAAAKRYLKSTASEGVPYLGLHHRLDRDTSGVLLFTKDPKANAAVAALFASRTARKRYLAIVPVPKGAQSGFPESWEVKNYLGKIGAQGKKARFGAVKRDGDIAHTEFRLLRATPEVALIEAIPHTGRTHQIRVHLAEGGHPIVGDSHYGSRVSASRVMLHAASLTFLHPVTSLEIAVQSPAPEDFRKWLPDYFGDRSKSTVSPSA